MRLSYLSLLMIACVWTPRGGCQSTGDFSFALSDGGAFDTTNSHTEGCQVELLSPSIRHDNVWTWASIWISHPFPTEALSVNLREVSPVAQMVPLQQVDHENGTLKEFVPERRLDADADYQIEITSCQGIFIHEFHTGLDGLGVFKEELQGHGWEIASDTVAAMEPLNFLERFPYIIPALYVGVSEAGELTLGTSVDNQQDWCLPTVSVPLIQRNLPEFSLAGVSLATAIEGHPYTLYDVQLNGTFVESERYLWTNMAFTLDVRELVTITGGSKNRLCSAVDTGCIPCEDGLAYCIPFQAWNLEGFWETNPISPVPDYNCDHCVATAPAADAICAGP